MSANERGTLKGKRETQRMQGRRGITAARWAHWGQCKWDVNCALRLSQCLCQCACVCMCVCLCVLMSWHAPAKQLKRNKQNFRMTNNLRKAIARTTTHRRTYTAASPPPLVLFAPATPTCKSAQLAWLCAVSICLSMRFALRQHTHTHIKCRSAFYPWSYLCCTPTLACHTQWQHLPGCSKCSASLFTTRCKPCMCNSLFVVFGSKYSPF